MLDFIGQFIHTSTNIRKLQKEISDMEFREQILLSVLEDDILKIQQKIDQIFYQIGIKVYDHDINHIQNEGLQAHYDEIATLKASKIKKEEKKQEIAARYDEEIGMLKTKLQTSQNAASAETDDPPPVCPQCGAAYAPEDDIFCSICGQKLLDCMEPADQKEV